MDLISRLGPLAFGSRLRRISERLMRDVSAVYREQQVSFEARWFPVLYVLSEHAPMGVTEIARELGFTHPAVNQIAGSMARAGLVASSRDAGDERRRLLSLTEKGRRTAQQLKPLWETIGECTRELVDQSGTELFAALETIEKSLDDRDMYVRIMERLGRPPLDGVKITPYRSTYRRFFKTLNHEWLEADFEIEPRDEVMLSDPKRQVIDAGGSVFFALLDKQVIGTVAIIRQSDRTFEIAKMAVTARYRGRGVGSKLLNAATEFARKQGAKTIVLFTSPKLEAANEMYAKHGFVPFDSPATRNYKRETVAMRLHLG